MVRKAVEPPGEARQDWRIIADLAQSILSDGERQVIDAPYAGWDYQNTAQIMAEITALTRATLAFLTNASNAVKTCNGP